MTDFSNKHQQTKGLPVRYVRSHRTILTNPDIAGDVGSHIDRISAALERAIPFPEAGATIQK